MQRIKNFTEKAAKAAAWIYLFVVVVVMPFYFTNGYGHIGSDKAHLCQKVAFPVMAIAFCLTCFYKILDLAENIKQKKIKTHVSVTDWMMLCFLASVLISYLFSEYKEHAVWGNSTWPMGLLTQLSVVASYYVFSRMFSGEKQFLSWVKAVSVIVFLLAVLNRFSVYPLQMEYAGAGFISTIGNINWFCGYWAAVVWIGVVSYWTQEVRGKETVTARRIFRKAGDVVLIAVGLAAGIAQGSDSGLLAMAAVFVTMFCLSVKNGDRMQRFWELALILCAVCMLGFCVHKIFPKALNYPTRMILLCIDSPLPWVCGIFSLLIYLCVRKQNYGGVYNVRAWKICRIALLVCIGAALVGYVVLALANTLLPEGLGMLAGNSSFVFDRAWGSNRGGTLEAGVRSWQGQNLWHKLVGVGPDCMSSYLYGNQDAALLEAVQEQFAGSRLLNAHSEWLTHLVNLGAFGMLSFAGVIISFLYRFLKGGKDRPVLYIFAFCVLGYTVNNIFSFQTMMNITMLFLLLGVGENIIRR